MLKRVGNDVGIINVAYRARAFASSKRGGTARAFEDQMGRAHGEGVCIIKEFGHGEGVCSSKAVGGTASAFEVQKLVGHGEVVSSIKLGEGW